MQNRTALKKFEHALPIQLYHAPSKMNRLDQGARLQYAEDDIESRKLTADEIKRIQKVVEKFKMSKESNSRVSQKVHSAYCHTLYQPWKCNSGTILIQNLEKK